jgi:hypothetical protein
VLIEERLELGTGRLIDDILSERRWKGGHKRSISGGPAHGKVPLTGVTGRTSAGTTHCCLGSNPVAHQLTRHPSMLAELSVFDLMELPSASIGEGSGEQGLERT